MANANADTLSHLPRALTGPDAPIPGEVTLLMDMMESSPTTPKHVRLMTGRNPVFSCVCEYIIGGWPGTLPQEEFKPFASRKQELSVHVGCVLWGARAVLPPQCRRQMVDMLHEGHPGIVMMKALAQSYMW